VPLQFIVNESKPSTGWPSGAKANIARAKKPGKVGDALLMAKREGHCGLK